MTVGLNPFLGSPRGLSRPRDPVKDFRDDRCRPGRCSWELVKNKGRSPWCLEEFYPPEAPAIYGAHQRPSRSFVRKRMARHLTVADVVLDGHIGRFMGFRE